MIHYRLLARKCQRKPKTYCQTVTWRNIMANKKPSGFILYRGPSLLDGKPIVVVAITKESKNSKTGSMLQTYIIRSDMHPVAAVRKGAYQT